MRYTKCICLVAVAVTAILIPDDATAQQLNLQAEIPIEKPAPKWSDVLQLSHLPTDTESKYIGKGLYEHLDPLGSLFRRYYAKNPRNLDKWSEGMRPVEPSARHHQINRTVYELIQASNYTRKFAALVDDFPDIVELLNSTSGANITAFIPVDKAFDRIAELDFPQHKVPKEFIRSFIEYHILPKNYSLTHIAFRDTLPTLFKPDALGGRPQRLRISGPLILRINGHTRVLVGNLFSKNGIIHGVDHLIVPPPKARDIISLFPTGFSTLELAARKTGLFPPHRHHHKKPHDDEDDNNKAGDEDENGSGDKDHHGHGDYHHYNRTGLTLFAPTNFAFKKLGPGANAFLFNTKKGLFYLRALLKYHVVVNETLYTDAYYGIQTGEAGSGGADEAEEVETFASTKTDTGSKLTGNFHIDMPTLLKGKSLAIDVHRWYAHVSMRVNSRVTVGTPFQDWVAHDGVLQVVQSVLIPPHKHKRHSAWWRDDVDGEAIAVEELVERLKPYIDEKELEGLEDGDEIIETEEETDKSHVFDMKHEQKEGKDSRLDFPIPKVLDMMKSINDEEL